MAPKSKLDPATPDQQRAWQFYGSPSSPAASALANSPERSPLGKQVGEVRYVIGWMADQMVRMGWRARFNGSETWSITDPETKEVIVSDAEVRDTDDPKHPANASRRLLSVIEWDSRTVREVTTNLFVAGELHYIHDGSRWRVVSVIRKNREELIAKATVAVHGLWPHPADPEQPDAPIFGVLGTLDDMAWLNRLSRSQSANRVGMRGIIGVSDQFATASGATGEAFWSDFEASLSRPMDNPEDVSPVGIIGSTELVKPEGSGMAGLSWIIPDFPYDDRIDERMDKLVQRLAYGLPIPPEILLGMQAQSKATAFQVEGATYRAHIEPVAMLVSRIASDTLSAFLPDTVGVLEINPDPTQILARRHSISDVLEAFDRGAVSFAYLREVLGIPEGAAATEEDILLRQRVGRNARTPGEQTRDPANVAAQEPLTAAATEAIDGEVEELTTNPEAPSPASEADSWLSETLHKIDQQVLYQLIGAFPQAVDRARDRLGARVRADAKLKAQVPTDIPNGEIPLRLGRDGFQAIGIDADAIISSAIEPTLKWWGKQVEDTRSGVTELLKRGDAAPEFAYDPSASVEMLQVLITESVYQDATPADERFRDIVDLAGR